MPDVKVTGLKSRNSTVTCPLNGAHIVVRDMACYAVHMCVHHGANAESFGATMYTQVGGDGPKDDGRNSDAHPNWPCYGCGSTFGSKSALLNHLLTVHGAS